MVTNQKVAVIITSSIGTRFERNGFHSYATLHNLEEKSSNITEKARNENLPLQAIQLDVNNEKSVIEGINRISEEKERNDVVVNNAGYWLMGALEETSMDEIKVQFKPTGLTGKTAEHGYWLRISDEGEVL